MKTLLAPLLSTSAGLLRSRALLHLEILSLRQQLAMVAARGHRRLRWTWKSHRRRVTGRPRVSREIRDLIRQLSRENPLWGAPRVHGELELLGISVSQTTVAKYMIRHRKPPSQTWRTFRQRFPHTRSRVM